MWRTLLVAGLLAMGACGDADVAHEPPPAPADPTPASPPEPDWRSVMLHEPLPDTAPTPFPESWDDISAAAINDGPTLLPLRAEAAGRSVVRAQILLDRALFSPGIIDGRWGRNTGNAVRAFQEHEGLEPTGELDEATFSRLGIAAGVPPRLVVPHPLTAEDVAGPFIRIPRDIYEHAELDCSCYESLREKLGERFHSDPQLLERLNPHRDLNRLRGGDSIDVPLVRDPDAAAGIVIDRIVVSVRGNYVQALDADDRVLLHLPSTLGSAFDPSPTGSFHVTRVHEDPWWHYQPAILAHVDDDLPDARIPPGPNNAVGVVWMALSKPHYGIHGTSRPETIGYAVSAGCVRLTNWDALFLARRIRPGVHVHFRDPR